LFSAANSGSTDLVRVLVFAGADVNTCRYDGVSPLHVASGTGCIDSVKLLLDRDAQFQSRDTRGYTPLYMAAQNGHT